MPFDILNITFIIKNECPLLSLDLKSMNYPVWNELKEKVYDDQRRSISSQLFNSVEEFFNIECRLPLTNYTTYINIQNI